MNKLILSTLLAASVVFAKEHCEPSLVSSGDYRQYHFTCYTNNGNIAEYDFFIDDDLFDGMEVNYFKNGIKYKKSVVFFDTEDTLNVYKGYVKEFDEYGVVVYGDRRMGEPKEGYMLILSFWNKVKKYIKDIKNDEIPKVPTKQEKLEQTKRELNIAIEPALSDRIDCPESWKVGDRCLQKYFD